MPIRHRFCHALPISAYIHAAIMQRPVARLPLFGWRAFSRIRLWLAGIRLRLAGIRLWLTGIGLRLTGIGLWLAGIGLWLTGIGLWLAGIGLWLAGIRLWLAGIRFRLAGIGLRLVGIVDAWIRIGFRIGIWIRLWLRIWPWLGFRICIRGNIHLICVEQQLMFLRATIRKLTSQKTCDQNIKCFRITKMLHIHVLLEKYPKQTQIYQ